LTNLGSESETCVGSRVNLVGVLISFEKNFYRLPFTPPSLVRRIGPSSVCPLWLLIVVLSVLIALGPLFIFFYALIGAAGAGELNPEYDYVDDFAAEDYQTPGSRADGL
jgi:hypothetical protein